MEYGSIACNLLVVEVCFFQIGNFGNLHGVSVLIRLASQMSMGARLGTKEGMDCNNKAGFQQIKCHWDLEVTISGR